VVRFILIVLAATIFCAMLLLISILNRGHHFRGFVYRHARFSSDHKSIEIAVRTAQRFCHNLFALATSRRPDTINSASGAFTPCGA